MVDTRSFWHPQLWHLQLFERRLLYRGSIKGSIEKFRFGVCRGLGAHFYFEVLHLHWRYGNHVHSMSSYTQLKIENLTQQSTRFIGNFLSDHPTELIPHHCSTFGFKNRVAQKLCRIILLNFHFPKNRKILSFMLFGPSGNVHDP